MMRVFAAAVGISLSLLCQEVTPIDPDQTVEIVAASAIPRPLPPAAYVMTGEPARKGAAEVLRSLMRQGIAVREAWESHESLCMRPYDPPQLIVLLSRAENRMRALGFAGNDASIDACYATWKHYRIAP
jgi:hypothetical protein